MLRSLGGDAAHGDATRPSKGDSLSAAANPEPSDPSEPVRGRIQRFKDFNRRRAAAGGLLLWGAAGAALAVHSTGLALPDPMHFALLEIWLIGLGCVLALRSLDRVAQPTSKTISLVCFAVALVLTVLMWGHALRFQTLDGTFAAIIPLAIGIQSAINAEAKARGERREQAVRQEGREEEAARQIDVRYAALAGLDRLERMTPAELGVVIDTAQRILGVKLAERSPRALASVSGIGEAANGSRRRPGWGAPPHRVNGIHSDRA